MSRCMTMILFVLTALLSTLVQGFTTTTTAALLAQHHHRGTISLHASTSSTYEQTIYLDGPEWASIQHYSNQQQKEQPDRPPSKVGTFTLVIGTSAESGDSVMGIKAYPSNNDLQQQRDHIIELISNNDDDDDKCLVWKDSVAKLPANNNKNDDVFMATYQACLGGIYTSLYHARQLQSVATDVARPLRAVVMGGGPHAQFITQGLIAAVAADDKDIQVYMVTTNADKLKQGNDDFSKFLQQNKANVQVISPEINSLAFSSYIGEFDILIDTIHDEAPDRQRQQQSTNSVLSLSLRKNDETVLGLLESRHKCHTYVSTMTQAQRIVQESGVVFGPGKVNEHIESLTDNVSLPPREEQSPFPGCGATVEALLSRDIFAASPNNNNNANKGGSGGMMMMMTMMGGGNKNQVQQPIVRSWTLGEFWEQASWPQDTTTLASVRFGLPVVPDDEDEEEDDDDEMEWLNNDNDEMVTSDVEESGRTDNSMWIRQISSVNQLTREIVQEKKSCLLFLSAKYCKRCQYLDPQYNRIAREYYQFNDDDGRKNNNNGDDNDDFIFAKVDTSNTVGKELGTALMVKAVPSFVFFREGRKFGTPIGLSRIPSKKFDMAMELLERGQEWDGSTFSEFD